MLPDAAAPCPFLRLHDGRFWCGVIEEAERRDVAFAWADQLTAALAEQKEKEQETREIMNEQINNGNPYIFCDHVEQIGTGQFRGCVRGAGHNGEHLLQSGQVPPQCPVLLQALAETPPAAPEKA